MKRVTMHAPSPAHPAAAALEGDPHTLLENALRHLRHANRCAALAFRVLDDHQASCAAVHGEILAAARATANLIDRLDGYGEAGK
jgi:hypothetical protein